MKDVAASDGLKMLNCLGLFRHHYAVRSRAPTQKTTRNIEIQETGTNNRPQLTKTIASLQWSSGQVPLQRPARTLLAALQDRTQRRPTFDSALVKWINRHTVWVSPSFRGDDAQLPWVDSTVEKCWTLASPCWLICLRREKIGKSPAPKLIDRWKPAWWLGNTATSPMNIWPAVFSRRVKKETWRRRPHLDQSRRKTKRCKEETRDTRQSSRRKMTMKSADRKRERSTFKSSQSSES